MKTSITNSQTMSQTNDPGNLMIILYLLGVALLALLSWCQPADAAVEEDVDFATVKGGQLLLPTGHDGPLQPAPLLAMDVDITISGIVARATVRQQFTNNTDNWAEAMYIFPLPDESAVDHLDMQVGKRHITGTIKKKKEAQKTYDQAKQAGHKASLLSQQRPNIFTTAVANIAPHETITITIVYQQIVQRHDDLFSLRFPMVVGPRYQPDACSVAGPTTILPTDDDPSSAPLAATEQSLVNKTLQQPPVIPPGTKPLNPVRLHINLAAGMELSRLASLYHGISTRNNPDNTIDITFTGKVLADRDFVLEWQGREKEHPDISLFSEQQGDDTYLLLMIMPQAAQPTSPLPRETIFILDTSGSMGGQSIRQSKEALRLAIGRMQPQDRFNIITFNNKTTRLFPASQPGSPTAIHQALSFVEQLEAEGGTEIRPAITMALDGKHNHERIRQVVFLTDACVTNEEELFSLIHARLGDTRLFTVGIGSAPNSYFMTRAATMGRGSYTYIGKLGEVREKMMSLFAMLEHPAMTNIKLQAGPAMEILPDPLPDLYQGEPLLALVKSDHLVKNMAISGQLPGQIPWQTTLAGSRFSNRPGIATLWARKKIRMLMDSLAAGGDPEEVKAKVTNLALTNHLVSRYTSLVAVEDKPARPLNEPLTSHRQQVNLPAGWQYNKIFAGSAATASPGPICLLLGLLLLGAAGTLTRITRQRS